MWPTLQPIRFALAAGALCAAAGLTLARPPGPNPEPDRKPPAEAWEWAEDLSPEQIARLEPVRDALFVFGTVQQVDDRERRLAGAEKIGLTVKPDAVHLPVRLTADASSPTEAAQALAERCRRLTGAAPAARLERVGYRSWTEKLVGLGLRGRVGVRFHSETTGFLRLPLADGWGFEQRVEALEELRGTLHPLDDGSSVKLGAARWVVSEPETHRPAAAAELARRRRIVADVLGVGRADLVADLGADLRVTVHGPERASVRLQLQLAPRTHERSVVLS